MREERAGQTVITSLPSQYGKIWWRVENYGLKGITFWLSSGGNPTQYKTVFAKTAKPSAVCSIRLFCFLIYFVLGGNNLGISLGSTRRLIDRACPGARLISPFSSSFRIIWCMVGYVLRKNRSKSASAGALPFITV